MICNCRELMKQKRRSVSFSTFFIAADDINGHFLEGIAHLISCGTLTQKRCNRGIIFIESESMYHRRMV